jgi:mannose-6-phosphate isomerase-like protein (cupin superfamily)
MTFIALSEALAALSKSKETFITPFRHGSMSVETYKPDRVDLQKPHTYDELYVVATGAGEFLCGMDQNPVRPGDVLFVAAGVEHRFMNFSTDFSAWVFFYGAEGGEG